MKTVTFQITAVQPLLLTSLQGDPNSSVSFPYIPGSVLRGALIGRYCQDQGKDLDLTDPNVNRWFFDGTTRYLNAYPLINGTHAIPAPRTLAAKKLDEWVGGKLTIYDRGVATPKERTLRSVTGFVTRDQRGRLWYGKTRMLVNIHNWRDRPRGRGVEDEGAVFRYEAIAPEQTFAATIICEDNDVDIITGFIPNRLWLGGSRSAGYGEVRIDNKAVVDNWNEILPVTPDEISDDDDDEETSTVDPLRLTITLTSDMILRNHNGASTTALLHQRISALLGVNISLDETRTVLGTSLVGGFNRTWGLPLPQTPALAAGSVLTYICDIPPTAAALSNLTAEGLGERRAEGFGRISCNMLPAIETHILHQWLPKAQDPGDKIVTQSQTLDSEAQELANLMARRILEQRLEVRLLEQVDRYQIGNTISNTQLARLRIIARRALGSGKLDVIERFLDRLPSIAREQFARARVDHQPFDSWIRDHLTAIAIEWGGTKLKVSVAGVTVEPDEKMKNDFTLRLLMAMARMKVKGGDNE